MGSSGLDSIELTVALLVLSGGVLLWGFERYRTNFSKSEFLVSILLAVGIFAIGLFPDMFDVVGEVLAIDRRPFAISLITNVTLVCLVLLLFARTRSNQQSIATLTRNLAIDQAANDDTDSSSVYVVIPAYNEAESIRSVVTSLPDTIGEYVLQPLVVSDGSTDATVERTAATDAIVVDHPINQGQGGALRTGFSIAKQHGADIVVTMDADGQHPVEELSRLIEPIADSEADYVVGSRYTGVDDSNNSATRQFGIRTFTALINVMTKADITDCTNGYRAIRATKLNEMTLSEERFSAPELLIEARKNGLRIKEIPITIAQRAAGETKKPKLGYAFGLTRTIFVTWLR
ncbi:DUF2304 family protein [Halocatena pleomorpha]|uniref:DUF2304 family protein n=1 Tax=Halocatena pleomorpha TaxID=1785090 RepID=A0A3P3RK07_9EURY|nr:DUF2304 family protein [Halocatena pleomorpha]